MKSFKYTCAVLLLLVAVLLAEAKHIEKDDESDARSYNSRSSVAGNFYIKHPRLNIQTNYFSRYRLFFF